MYCAVVSSVPTHSRRASSSQLLACLRTHAARSWCRTLPLAETSIASNFAFSGRSSVRWQSSESVAPQLAITNVLAEGRPTIHDPPVVRRPGDRVDTATIVRNWWAFPAVGFNSILEIPVQKLEVFAPDDPQDAGALVVPNSIFGVPLRKDLVYKIYWYHRRWLAGYDNTCQLYKWEWPGSNKKVRSQKKSGKSRMGRRKAPGRFEGVFANPIRPRDWRQRRNRKTIWKTVKVMLSVKFAQKAIHVVDSFNLRSHKTKYLVQHLRRILGRKCHSAMLVHEGHVDVNDNFRWASAHIASIRRENVEGVSVYNLLKYHEVVFTEAALAKLITEIQTFPQKNGWGQKFATPDGQPAPVPEKVLGWNAEWIAKKERMRNSEHRLREFYHEQQKWKWSHELKGPLKVPRHDPLAGFRIKDFILNQEKPIWEKLESLYVDDEPLEEEAEDDEYEDLIATMDRGLQADGTRGSDLIDDPTEIETTSLRSLARGGRKSSRIEGNTADRSSSPEVE